MLNKNNLIVFNPIFYDLGLSFAQTLDCLSEVQRKVEAEFTEWTLLEQNYAFEAYNFSYLSLHLPVLKFHLQRQILTIVDREVTIDLSLSLRMTGAVCFEYRFEIENSDNIDFDALVKQLQTYVNVAYRQYLQEINAFQKAMTRLDVPQLDDIPSIFNNGAIVQKLRLLLDNESISSVNEYVYPYQHGRLLYFIDADDQSMRDVLLKEDFCQKAQLVCDGSVYIDTWKTVHLGDDYQRQLFVDLYLDNLAKFFQCQIWIFQCEHKLNHIDEKLVNNELDFELLNQQAQSIESFYFSCNRQMINFNNLSIPYKNDYYVELSKSIMDALKLQQHIDQTYTHLSAVKEHINIAKLQTESRTERHTKLLKLLMALNLSAGIASLIPSSLDGDIDKLNSSILPPMVWGTFAVIAGLILFLETRNSK